MSDEIVLEPLEVKEIDFYGDKISAALVQLDVVQQIYVPIRPLCEYLGLNWSGQFERIKRNPVMETALSSVRITRTQGKRSQNLVALQLEMLPGWLFGIEAQRVKPELKDKIIRYQRECFRVLWQAFQTEVLGAAPIEGVTPAVLALMQIRENSLAIARMAEQQIELEKRVTNHDSRFDKAVEVFKGLDRRVSELESRVSPPSQISEAQAAEIQLAVKAAAEYLSSKDNTKNHFQSIFQELYRHFRVSSYKNIRVGDYEAVLTFLRNLTEKKISK